MRRLWLAPLRTGGIGSSSRKGVRAGVAVRAFLVNNVAIPDPASATPAAAPAPIPRNCLLDNCLLVIAGLLSFKNGKTGHPFGVAGCTTGSTRPQCPYLLGTNFSASTCLVGREDTGYRIGALDTNTLTV